MDGNPWQGDPPPQIPNDPERGIWRRWLKRKVMRPYEAQSPSLQEPEGEAAIAAALRWARLMRRVLCLAHIKRWWRAAGGGG